MLPKKEAMKTKYKNPTHYNKPNTQCVICDTPIYVRPSRQIAHNCCSIGCRNKWFSKERSPVWKGGVRDKQKTNMVAYERKRKYKKYAIDLLGGKCCICGYNKSISAIDFHHINPNEKTKTIKDISAGSLEKVLTEAKKCVLLCANCHREHHYNEKNNIKDYQKSNKIINKSYEQRVAKKTLRKISDSI
jgi:hypothetical protein